MVKVLILGPTLLQRVTEPELDVDVEGSVPVKLLIIGRRVGARSLISLG